MAGDHLGQGEEALLHELLGVPAVALDGELDALARTHRPPRHLLVTSSIAELGPRYQARPGGYTRILKMGFRVGDNAPMALVELVDRPAPAEAAEGARAG